MLATAKLQTIVCTLDLERAISFYVNLLDLRCKGHSEGAAVFDVAGCDLRISPVTSLEPSAHTVVGFGVQDLRDEVRQLVKRGIVFERFPAFPHDETGVVRTPSGSLVAWFRDPDGNLLSMVEFPR